MHSHPQTTYAARVRVFAGDDYVYTTHAADARRLMLDGLAVRRCTGRTVRALNLVVLSDEYSKAKPAAGNPHKYTFREPLRNPSGEVDAHCHAHKPHIAHPRNWPIFRSALIECLPPSQQAAIRRIFSRPGKA